MPHEMADSNFLFFLTVMLLKFLLRGVVRQHTEQS